MDSTRVSTFEHVIKTTASIQSLKHENRHCPQCARASHLCKNGAFFYDPKAVGGDKKSEQHFESAARLNRWIVGCGLSRSR